MKLRELFVFGVLAAAGKAADYMQDVRPILARKCFACHGSVELGKPGRDHDWHGFTMWMAGAGVKGGEAVGATDELGFEAVEDRVHVSDLHATLLHLMGMDHTKLTYFYQGFDQRLTGVRGVVVKKVLA